MSNVFIQIPVIQKIKQFEPEESTRIVQELIAPKYIIRISPAEKHTIIWLAHGAAWIETPLSYEEVINTLKQTRVKKNDTDTDTD